MSENKQLALLHAKNNFGHVVQQLPIFKERVYNYMYCSNIVKRIYRWMMIRSCEYNPILICHTSF